ncbi:flagellin [Paenibacillus sp. OAS669]|uniref:flagellin N-terminal helical domain-containing protein n=1 Tax=Paenibacillus sp. OAS669 TaxID=2663821 RepID=UPI00178B6DA4|nr:flagellin [Paenibacillus sp. OAS669]MBE1447429.1 flagellin [Paenibacillus sp. OAS669]
MIINHNMNALNTHRQMGLNNASAGKNMEKLSSGLRINRAADDAAGLSISEKMRGQIRSMEQAQRNAQDGISLVQTAEGALTEVSDMLVRIKELYTQRANGTYNTTDQANIDEELTALKSEITNIGTNTKFNDIQLLKGTLNKDIQINHTSTDTLNISLTTDMSGVGTAASSLDNATAQIDVVAKARAQLGALQNRLEHTSNNLGTTTENLTAAESRIRDTDMAKEMVALTKNNILLQASQAMLAQANQQPQGVLSLLR